MPIILEYTFWKGNEKVRVDVTEDFNYIEKFTQNIGEENMSKFCSNITRKKYNKRAYLTVLNFLGE